MDASMVVRGYMVQSGNSVYKSSAISRDLTPSRIRETWEKMRPEKRYGQMTPKERIAFMLSDDGLNYLSPFVITVDGTSYEQMVPGRVARVFAEESREVEQPFPREESNNILKTAFLLFANQVDAATTFAQNCGGGGSAPDKDWGRDVQQFHVPAYRRPSIHQRSLYGQHDYGEHYRPCLHIPQICSLRIKRLGRYGSRSAYGLLLLLYGRST